MENWDQYRVTGLAQSSEFDGELFDSLLYPTAGVGGNQLAFFQSGIGSGVTTAPGATVGNTKTEADTNMNLNGQLSSGSQFLAYGLELHILPGSSGAASTYTPASPVEFAAVAAATVDAQIADVSLLQQSGVVVFKVLDKEVYRAAMMGACPPRHFLDLAAAATSNSATTGLTTIAAARSRGQLCQWENPVLLDPGMSFGVFVNFPGLVATPSGFNARVVAKLVGKWRRSVQ